MQGRTYGYYANSNKLRQTASAQGNNYEYDAIGNLTKDVSGGVTNIEWTPSGKVRKVTKSTGSPIEFRYDAAGNRVEKKQGTTITRYIRDASGNVMAVYQADTLSERPIYGSSRLGNLSYASKPGYRTVGHKQYELSNHLGNVLAVVSDRIRMKTDSTWTQVLSRTDYYPFGLEMTGRTESMSYRYGFNGKEKDPSGQWSNQTHYDYGFRIYNPTIGKFLSVDPLTKSYPWYTPYQFAGNKPIRFIDLDGLEEYDPLSDPLFTAKLVKTYAYDVALAIKNATNAMFGSNFRKVYKIDENGNETFEVETVDISNQNPFVTLGQDGLNLLTLLPGGKSVTGNIFSRSIGYNQLVRSIKSIASSYSDGKHIAPKNVPWKKVVESTTSGPAKFKNGIDPDKLTLEAWKDGVNVSNGKDWKVYKSNDIIGAYKGKETEYLRVERTIIGNEEVLHSHPIDKIQFNKLIKPSNNLPQL